LELFPCYLSNVKQGQIDGSVASAKWNASIITGEVSRMLREFLLHSYATPAYDGDDGNPRSATSVRFFRSGFSIEMCDFAIYC